MFETIAARIGASILFGKLKNIQIPRWVWILVAIIISVVGFYIYHSIKVSHFEKTIRTDQQTKDQQAFDEQLKSAHQDAVTWKNKYVASSTVISTQGSVSHEAAISDHAALADSLRKQATSGSYRGQVDSASPQSGSSEHQQGNGTTIHAEVGPVFDDQRSKLIAVPLDDLISFAQHYDDNRDEVKTWRDDKIKQENLYDTLLNDQVSGK